MPTALIALGSNLGDRIANIEAAIARIGREWTLLARSGLYETAPKYVTDQPAFINAAISVKLDIEPIDALRKLKTWERELGREDGPRNGPRRIDLDLIAYDEREGHFEEEGLSLELPHPRAFERRFVLAPLAEIAPDFVLLGFGRVSDLLAVTIDPPQTVRRLE